MTADKSTIIKGVVFGTVLGALLIALLLCLSAIAFLSTGALPENIIAYMIVAFNAAGAFFGGYVATRVIKQNGMVWGLCVGGVLLVVCIIGGIFVSGASVSTLILYKAAAFVLFGVIGGVKGVNHKDKIKIK
ncbi:MAG: TIGR04086 family membrane protein [Oscillospiraceae bacterium]|jgi:putative membrane protein (TIGR04086 family)|nr:TIGR04086 family membrane protein [Oscillospiraceae bacterium]